jgi:hypothetical protein
LLLLPLKMNDENQAARSPKKLGLGKLREDAKLISKSTGVVAKLRSSRTSDLLKDSYDTVAELWAGSPCVNFAVFV